MRHLKTFIYAALLAGTSASFAAPPPDTAGGIPVPKGTLPFGFGEGGIKNVEATAVLNPGGTTASVRVSIDPIPKSASIDSPHCAPYRVDVGGVYLDVDVNRMSSCVRVCIKPPADMAIDPAQPLTGTLSQGWSAIFNPEWYADTKIMCGHVKSWSAHSTLTATLTIGVCPAGSGCLKAAAPAPAPAPAAQVARSNPPERFKINPRLAN